MNAVSNMPENTYYTQINGPVYEVEVYNNAGDVILSQWLEHSPLDNTIQKLDCMPFQEGDVEMATKINRTVKIDGVKRWIHANTEQEYAEKLIEVL